MSKAWMKDLTPRQIERMERLVGLEIVNHFVQNNALVVIFEEEKDEDEE